jgi:hypothetical protein
MIIGVAYFVDESDDASDSVMFGIFHAKKKNKMERRKKERNQTDLSSFNLPRDSSTFRHSHFLYGGKCSSLT